MSLVPNKSYKLKLVMEQMVNKNSSEEFIKEFQRCFPMIWYRIQYFHDMDMKDEGKRDFERIPKPEVYVEHLYQEARKKYTQQS